MAQIREIRKRIKAVANIKRITRTMQMIAAAKFAQAQQRATATKPFTEGVFELVRELASTAGDLDHPLISGPAAKVEGAPEVTLVITSDRGLCGPYNGQVLRTYWSHRTSSEAARAGRSELIGKKGVNFLRFHHVPVDKAHTFGDKPVFAEVERLAQRYMDQFLAGEISGVNVVYMNFISAGRQAPRVLQLLPLKPPAGEGGAKSAESSGPLAIYEFSPSADELLNELLPTTVKTTLFQCLIEAIASEQAARMVAMKAATDNAGKMGKELTRQFNRARQSQITTELTEIISGAAALE